MSDLNPTSGFIKKEDVVYLKKLGFEHIQVLCALSKG